MTTKPSPLSVNFDKIPDSLKAIPRWVLWRYVEQHDSKTGKISWKKVPHTAKGKFASSVGKNTWATFEAVQDAYLFGEFDGIGITINGSGDFQGIDIDGCLTNGKLNQTAQELLDRVDGYAEISPSGNGIKLFTRSNLAVSTAKKPIEVYRDGRYFTVTGHTINGHADLPDSVQDVSWFVEKHIGRNDGQEPGDGSALALYKAPLVDWDVERVRKEVIPYITDAESYEGWLKIGMALHHQGQGDEDWLDLWDEISRETESYNRQEIESKWDSFNEQRDRGQGALTLASLIKDASKLKAEENIRKFEAVKAKVEECEDAETLRSTICADIQKDLTIDKFHRDVLAAILKTKFKSLGMPVGIAEVKKLIRPKLMEGIPEWLEDWVYVTHSDQFFNMSTKRKAKVQGFNAMYNREVGASSSEPGSSAAALALDLFKIPTPDKVMYIPWAGEMFDMNGLPCVNSYNVNSVPDIPAAFSSSDLKALKTIKSHLKLILVDDDSVNVLTHWMAHNVQNPGKKIRWVPLIKGIEGDGKSLIGKIVSMAMGHVNVGVVSPDVIGGSFSSWSEGKCVNVLEEIRLVGHNRYDLVNKLKPYISNDQIEVHRKGENPYDAPNVTNYIAFTNYQDAIPLDDTDRRWWIQFSPFNSETELREMTGHGYFSELHEAIENHAGAIRRWLLEVEIPVTFQADGRAPFSHAKQKMIAMNVSDEESAAREIIEKGCLGVSKEVVSTTHLVTALSMMEDAPVLQTSAVSRLMSKLGFSRVPNPIKWQNSTIRVWTKSYNLSRLSGSSLNAEVRKILDSTLPKDEDDLLS